MNVCEIFKLDNNNAFCITVNGCKTFKLVSINEFNITLFVGGLEALKKGQMAVWVAGNKVYTLN